MKHTDRERLASLLAGMDQNERNRIYKRAAKLRKQSRRPEKSRRARGGWENADDDEPPQRPRGAGGRSLHCWALQVLALEEAADGAAPAAAGAGATGAARVALVVGIGPGSCEVLDGGLRRQCRLDSDLRAKQQSGIAVGDRVLVREHGDGLQAAHVLPRASRLARPDPHNPHRERVLVANVEAVVVVVAVKSPPLRTGMIDRFLVAIEHGGAKPIVCANKTDLCTEDERETELAKLSMYSERGVPVVACSAERGQGLDELRTQLAGRLCAFVGKSGVGKSSLLNALAPDLGLDTAEIRAGDGRGRHTTTSSTLYELAGGARVIDTPGIRALGLARLAPAELRPYFPDLESWAGGCRFRDCTHSHEPDCEVRAAVTAGHVPHARWLAYLRILGVDDEV